MTETTLIEINSYEELEYIFKLLTPNQNGEYDDSDDIDRCLACYEYHDKKKPFYISLNENSFGYNETKLNQKIITYSEFIENYLKN